MNREVSRGYALCNIDASSRGTEVVNFNEGHSGYTEQDGKQTAFHGEYCLKETHDHLTLTISTSVLSSVIED